MSALSKILFILGYLSLVGPPRTFKLQSSEQKQEGELSNQPLIVILMVEYLMRSVMLLVIFYGIEIAVGSVIYETYLLDYLGALLLAIGAFHTISYYLCFAMIADSKSPFRLRLYRLLRNLAYSGLPGVGVVAVLLLVEFLKEREAFTNPVMIINAYLYTTAVVLLIAMIEWMLVKRRPLGLDVE